MKSTRQIVVITFALAILAVLVRPQVSRRTMAAKTMKTTFTFQGSIDKYSSDQPVRVLLNYIVGTRTSPRCAPVWTTADLSGLFSITTDMVTLPSQMSSSEAVSFRVAFAHQAIRLPTFELMFFREGRRPVTLHLIVLQPKKNDTLRLGILNLDMMSAAARNVDDPPVKEAVDEYLSKCSVQGKLICQLRVFPLTSNCGTPGCQWVELALISPYHWEACISKEHLEQPQFVKAMTKAKQYLGGDPWQMLASLKDEEIYQRVNAFFSGGVWWIVRR